MADLKTGAIEITPVRSARDRRQFIELPYRLYRNHPHWIAPLRIAQKDILNTRRHPFYKTSDAEMFLAKQGGRVVGRIMAIVNHAHNEFHHERVGFFGFFEVESDQQAAASLIDAARDWVRTRGAETIRGPVNPSTNYECGLLVDGFDLDPMVMMTYNPPYYSALLEGCGMQKAMDLYAFDIAASYFNHSQKLQRVAERLRRKSNIKVRTVNMKDFRNEVGIVRRVYNDAWSRNWGFVPMSEEEFDHMAKDLKQIVDPRVVLIAEQELEGGGRRPVGFLLAVLVFRARPRADAASGVSSEMTEGALSTRNVRPGSEFWLGAVSTGLSVITTSNAAASAACSQLSSASRRSRTSPG